MESPLLGNIWNPHSMLRDGADLWGPSQCVWGMVRLGHFPPPTDKNEAYACRRGRNLERDASHGSDTHHVERRHPRGGTHHNLA